MDVIQPFFRSMAIGIKDDETDRLARALAQAIGESPRTCRTAGEAARQTEGAATRRARPPDSGTCRAAPGAECARRGRIDRLRPTRRTALTATVLDTSALTALLLDEPAAARLLAALEVEESR